MFPFLPVPPRHRVAESAVVQEETLLHPCTDCERLLDDGQRGRHLELVFHIPRDSRVAIVFQVIVQTDSHTVGRIAADDELAVLRREREEVAVLPLRGKFFTFYLC